MPNMSDMAKPLNMGSSKIKSAPSIAASPVSTIGFERVMAELMIAFLNSTPERTCKLMKSTKRMEFLTMMPAKAIIPIMLVAVY